MLADAERQHFAAAQLAILGRFLTIACVVTCNAANASNMGRLIGKFRSYDAVGKQDGNRSLPRLRWFQFSLRSLFLLVLLVSLLLSPLAVRMDRARRQRDAITKIVRLGGWCQYDYQTDRERPGAPPARRPCPPWALAIFGPDFFFDVSVVRFELGCNITDDDLECLRELRNIREIVIISDKITDTGLRHLSRCKNLKVVILDECISISDAGVAHLDGLHDLESLVLDGSAITDSGLARLASLSKLRCLSVWRTRVTREGITRLREALPQTLVDAEAEKVSGMNGT